MKNIPYKGLNSTLGTLGLALSMIEDEKGEALEKLDSIEIRSVRNLIKIAHSELKKERENVESMRRRLSKQIDDLNEAI